MLAIQLCHPSSRETVDRSAFPPQLVKLLRISCGTTRVADVDLSESADFFPTYASWNSALFETSVILTICEHADQLIGDQDVAIVHTDIEPHWDPAEIWLRVQHSLKHHPNRPIGLTVPAAFSGLPAFQDWLIPQNFPVDVRSDPMKLHCFDHGINVWDFIEKYDFDTYTWAMDTNPRMIYSHQFACSRQVLDRLGEKLHAVSNRLRLRDIGLWTPHMFERLISLYLVRYNTEPLLTTAFWHHSSSGTFGGGEQTLYGPRGLKYYKIMTSY